MVKSERRNPIFGLRHTVPVCLSLSRKSDKLTWCARWHPVPPAGTNRKLLKTRRRIFTVAALGWHGSCEWNLRLQNLAYCWN